MDPGRYTRTAAVLHWLIAALIFVGFPLGWYVSTLRLSPLKLQLVSYHKWIGVTVVALATVRILWRLSHRPPARPAGSPAWQNHVADAVHWSLYALMLALPITGWLYSSAAGIPTVYLGLWQLPDLVMKSKPVADGLHFVHQTLAWTLGALVLIHIVAALKHHFVDRDGLLRRMSVMP